MDFQLHHLDADVLPRSRACCENAEFTVISLLSPSSGASLFELCLESAARWPPLWGVPRSYDDEGKDYFDWDDDEEGYDDDEDWDEDDEEDYDDDEDWDDKG